MESTGNFKLRPDGKISRCFHELGISGFEQAINFIRHLPYRRNTDKDNLLTVFSEGCGTCGTKHAVLKALAEENDHGELKLVVGMFRMNSRNTPQVGHILQQAGLAYLPEAHCYLKTGKHIIDATTVSSDPSDFSDDMMAELEISPDQVGTYKVQYHRGFIDSWLRQNPQVTYSLDELWQIREKCILQMSVATT